MRLNPFYWRKRFWESKFWDGFRQEIPDPTLGDVLKTFVLELFLIPFLDGKTTFALWLFVIGLAIMDLILFVRDTVLPFLSGLFA